jgi:methyl coenzyme M reductase subunit C
MIGSSRQQKQVFDPHELRTLDMALADALGTMSGFGLKQEGLEALLRDRLFKIARGGVTDHISMRNKLLKSIDTENGHN